MPIEEFISQYEEAAETVGASSQDLANQILPFIRGPDLQDEVEVISVPRFPTPPLIIQNQRFEVYRSSSSKRSPS
ncbi:hypothetical protein PGT21_013066 [Puccinia graminis f. sp. tritici]|uniref:Uncharacterized protein n=1 Tax=Puccinia graminis f. sp. tritici TaxID=56615 RepID=A0A5B0PRT3_PUCGR|nr:hypothetical protein PGT21_013066 [Puccinia graminis f. sp. tritici]